jgi:hypothetical protein
MQIKHIMSKTRVLSSLLLELSLIYPLQALKKVGRRKQYKFSSRNKHVYLCISLRYASFPYNPTSHIQYENLKVPWYSE